MATARPQEIPTARARREKPFSLAISMDAPSARPVIASAMAMLRTGQISIKMYPTTKLPRALGTLPLLSSDALGHELGPVLRLQDGRALVIGANGLTALYTPGTNTWAAGPSITGTLNGHPATFGADDAPAAILPNGHVILAADAGPAAVTSTGNTTAGSEIGRAH